MYPFCHIPTVFVEGHTACTGESSSSVMQVCSHSMIQYDLVIIEQDSFSIACADVLIL